MFSRVCGVQLLLQPSHYHLEFAHLFTEGVAFGGLRAAFVRGQSLKLILMPRLAPSRQMGTVHSHAAKQPDHFAEFVPKGWIRKGNCRIFVHGGAYSMSLNYRAAHNPI